LDKLGLHDIKIVGVDFLRPLIMKAKENAIPYKNISFEVADVTDINTARMIRTKFGSPDVIIAMYLLQDTPDLEGTMKMASLCLKEGGHFIAVVVHPDFAEHLSEAGYVKHSQEEYLPREYVTDSSIVQWRFVGLYPIAREDDEPFYLPYFHRFIEDYYRAFEMYEFTIIDNVPLIPDRSLFLKYGEKRISPFYENKRNVYWPLIQKEPSSMVIHAIKKK
jgi:SAM-dependent methyltransferase